MKPKNIEMVKPVTVLSLLKLVVNYSPEKTKNSICKRCVTITDAYFGSIYGYR